MDTTTQALYTQMRNAIVNQPELAFRPLQTILKELQTPEGMGMASQILEALTHETDESFAAEKMWMLLKNSDLIISEKLQGRSELIWNQVSQHLAGSSLLDFGCGDGKIAAKASQAGHEVIAYDVDDYRIAGQDIEFISDWQEIKNAKFDIALAVTVFHHCEDPEKEITRLRKVARRVIVIESVIDEAMPWASQAFVDWLYNRGMHPGAAIPVPGQFKTVEGWRRVFAEHGFKVICEQDLDIDLPIVPEHHYLFVIEQHS